MTKKEIAGLVIAMFLAVLAAYKVKKYLEPKQPCIRTYLPGTFDSYDPPTGFQQKI